MSDKLKAQKKESPKVCKRHDWERDVRKPLERTCRKCGLLQTWGTHD